MSALAPRNDGLPDYDQLQMETETYTDDEGSHFIERWVKESEPRCCIEIWDRDSVFIDAEDTALACAIRGRNGVADALEIVRFVERVLTTAREVPASPEGTNDPETESSDDE